MGLLSRKKKKWARNFPGPRPFASKCSRGGNFTGTTHRKDRRTGALAKKLHWRSIERLDISLMKQFNIKLVGILKLSQECQQIVIPGRCHFGLEPVCCGKINKARILFCGVPA